MTGVADPGAEDKGLLLRSGRILDPASGTDAIGDVRVRDGQVAEIGRHEDGGALDADGEQVVDCTGRWVLPAFVDLHTHLREPGFEDAETIATGTAAAAAGGYGAVCAMANTDPVCDTPAVAELVARRAREVGLADVFPVGAVTVGLDGRRLAELGALRDCGAAVDFFSDDGRPVADALVMRRALQYSRAFDAVICNHSQNVELTAGAQMNEGAVSSRLGLPGWPREAEEAMVARDLILADGVGARLHVPHVSTAGTVELIRAAKARGVAVTAEVTPHHLVLDDAEVAAYDPAYKVNPPLRTASDTAALRRGLADGTIDAVATDHAPHPTEDKEREWQDAPCGMLGLETAFAVVVTELVSDRDRASKRGREGVPSGRADAGNGDVSEDAGDHAPGLDLLTAVARFTTGPAGVRDVGGHGYGLTVGNAAHITVIEPDRPWTVDARELHSKSANTPFAGHKLVVRPVHTLRAGRFTLRDGRVRT